MHSAGDLPLVGGKREICSRQGSTGLLLRALVSKIVQKFPFFFDDFAIAKLCSLSIYSIAVIEHEGVPPPPISQWKSELQWRAKVLQQCSKRLDIP
jgi:hypothetical protein